MVNFLMSNGNQTLFIILFVFNLGMCGIACLFLYESWREQESRAIKFGLVGILIHVCFIGLIFYVPALRNVVLMYAIFILGIGLLLLIPGKKNSVVLQGSAGFIVGDVSKFDERDIVFARNDSLQSGSEQYQRYYRDHPEREERDAVRRSKGGNLGKMGSVDNHPSMIVNKVIGSVSATAALVPISLPKPPEDSVPFSGDPKMVTNSVKQWAYHLGADLVGVCEIDQRWLYSHKGYIKPGQDIDTWGQEINRDFTHAIVIATEMDHDVMFAAPHTPVVMETMINYSKGAFISTTIANGLTPMGYEAIANHASYYESMMVPLGIDAGIGQMSRMGYLVSDKTGGRMRLAAVLTNMPLVADKPVDLGLDEFCQVCKKCAESCPSRSIPLGDKTVKNGLLRWTLNDETCHDYWGRVGTDCGVCMIVCPYSRPNKSLHRLVKWVLKRSTLARKTLPHLDNIVYGKKWKTRRSPAWVSYRN